MSKQKPQVAVVMGSDSDWPVMPESIKLLTVLGIACEARVISAHRTPEMAASFAKKAEKSGV